MKRVIREVITLVRIERWLVRDESSPTPQHYDEQIPEVQTEEIAVSETVPGSEDLRVIAQRILDAQQWEMLPDGTFQPKRLVNELQTPKEVE